MLSWNAWEHAAPFLLVGVLGYLFGAFATWLNRKVRLMGLDIVNLQGQTKTVEVKGEGYAFDVEYHPAAATRTWQTDFGNLQRDLGDATQDNDEEEIAQIKTELTEKLQELIESWDLQSDGKPIPVTGDGMDMLPLPIQQQIFQQLLTDASGGSEEEKKRKKRRSSRGSS